MNTTTQLLWEPGKFPDLRKTRFACGSRNAVESVAFQVAKQDGALGHIDLNAIDCVPPEELKIHQETPCARWVNFAVFEKFDINRNAMELVKDLLLQLPRS